MKTHSVRVWLFLLLASVVAVPALATAFMVLIRPPLPVSEATLMASVDPALREEVLSQVNRWADPQWQAGIAQRLAGIGYETLLIDSQGRVVYQSRGWSDRNGDGVSPATVSLMAPDGEGAAAMLRFTPERVFPPWSLLGWFNMDFWRIPLAQLAALLAIAGAIAFFVHRAFLRPLTRMIEAMRQVGAGDLDVRLPRSRVTEVDEVATAFAAMAGELRTSLERQEGLEQERRLIIGAVVHDLRTPLFSLRGYLEGLATGLADTPEKTTRYVRVCREKADALDRLVSDLFAFARTEYLEEAPCPEALELGDLLRRNVEGLQFQAAAKGVRIELVPPETLAPVTGDPALLTRAIENLLDNAVRHTPAGGVVRVAWATTPDGATFSVADSGPGIALDDLQHVFAPLYRGEVSRNRRTGGAGLGLTIARRLVRAHGGELIATNGATGGALFRGTIPHLTAAHTSGIPGETSTTRDAHSGAALRSPAPDGKVAAARTPLPS